MKLGIMQPYFFPYIGYWQLLNVVDKYVIYDDVNYIKGGWINRNRILVNGVPKYFNLPMLGASPFKKINEIQVNNENVLIAKNMRMIEGAYKKAPFYGELYPLLEKILYCQQENIASYIKESFMILCDYLEINTELLVSSELNKNCELKGQEKVIHICKLLQADEYYNAIGGQQLYSFEEFQKEGIKLKFIQTDEIQYKQFDNEFQSNLSIIDVMMFNGKEGTKKLLEKYRVLDESCNI